MFIICRIFYSPDNSSNFVKEDINEFLKVLEDDGGRDGNGIYLFSEGLLQRKADGMPDIQPNGKFLFHTRMATNGTKKSYNNQPFVGKRYIMVHNGVFSRISSYAELLGFRGSDNKYSDSYMIHYVIEKVGLLNFWLTFKDSSVGVIVAYDKELNITFLLKFSGSFEACKIDEDDYLYATSRTEYWKNKEVVEIDNGLYRLYPDRYELMDEKETVIYTWHSKNKYKTKGRYNYDNYYGQYYESEVEKEKEETEPYHKREPYYRNIADLQDMAGITKIPGFFFDKLTQKYIPISDYKFQLEEKTDVCTYCGNGFNNDDRIFYDWGFPICETCFNQYIYDGLSTDVNGVPLLDCLMKEKKELNPDEIINISKLFNIDTGLDALFPTKKQTTKLLPDHKKIRLKVSRQAQKSNKAEKQCYNCIFRQVNISDYPCNECQTRTEDGNLELVRYCPEKECWNCKHLMKAGQEYPCSYCTSANKWESKDNYGQDKCYHCGYHFDDSDEAVYDKRGHRVCHECDEFNMEYYDYSDYRRLG